MTSWRDRYCDDASQLESWAIAYLDNVQRETVWYEQPRGLRIHSVEYRLGEDGWSMRAMFEDGEGQLWTRGQAMRFCVLDGAPHGGEGEAFAAGVE